MTQAWTELYELRGLPSTSVLFGAWAELGKVLLHHGALVRFRRALMRPVLFHVDHVLRECDPAAVDQLLEVR